MAVKDKRTKGGRGRATSGADEPTAGGGPVDESALWAILRDYRLRGPGIGNPNTASYEVAGGKSPAAFLRKGLRDKEKSHQPLGEFEIVATVVSRRSGSLWLDTYVEDDEFEIEVRRIRDGSERLARLRKRVALILALWEMERVAARDPAVFMKLLTFDLRYIATRAFANHVFMLKCQAVVGHEDAADLLSGLALVMTRLPVGERPKYSDYALSLLLSGNTLKSIRQKYVREMEWEYETEIARLVQGKTRREQAKAVAAYLKKQEDMEDGPEAQGPFFELTRSTEEANRRASGHRNLSKGHKPTKQQQLVDAYRKEHGGLEAGEEDAASLYDLLKAAADAELQVDRQASSEDSEREDLIRNIVEKKFGDMVDNWLMAKMGIKDDNLRRRLYKQRITSRKKLMTIHGTRNWQIVEKWFQKGHRGKPIEGLLEALVKK